MRISALEIKNYRNLDGVKIKFHPTMNFIIGENNLGKSNLLDLLNILFNKNNFSESDFLNLDEQIHITFSLGLSEIEQGFFDDLFDPTDREKINIVAVQESPDDVIRFQHQESGTVISNNIVRCVNYINYDSLRNPSSELSFSKNRGVGRFLNHIIVKYLEDGSLQDFDFVSIEKIDEFLIEINQCLQKIKSFKDFSVQAIREENKENLLAKLILLADGNNRALESLGYGVQFSIIITLSIFERLLSLSKQRLDRCIIADSSNSEKYIPILIGFDEPEIHLHPYAQRSLIKYLGRVVNNHELDFSSLLTDIFQINKLLGQILVVSHSPSILLNDYRQFLRFCKDESGCLTVRNGFDINLDKATEKQLLKNLPYVKEAFFSKTVILVEGDSELGAFPIFSERMNVDLDELGISVVQAGSADSIPPLMKLLNEFGIQNIGLMDADKKATYGGIPNLFFTQGIDFEEDMYDSFNIADYAKYLEEEFSNENKANFFIGKAKSISISLDTQNLIHPQLASLPLDKTQNIKNISKQDVLNTLRRNKSLLAGRDLGKYVTAIPQVYEELIQKAVELSTNAK
jgi:putative ATP-dependent endonuclease of the OLD family